jgi:hypothetical protein
MRTTEFAPAVVESPEAGAKQAPVQGYGTPAVALPWKAGRFSGPDFTLQPDGALHCPEGKTLRPTEQRREADGSLRILYSARILDCRDCSKRPQCQWHGEATIKPRRISLLLHPLRVGPAPLLCEIGADVSTDVPVCNSCVTNELRCVCHPLTLLCPLLQICSLYIKLRTSPLDTGLEQEYTCSIRLLNVPGKGYLLHPA